MDSYSKLNVDNSVSQNNGPEWIDQSNGILSNTNSTGNDYSEKKLGACFRYNLLMLAWILERIDPRSGRIPATWTKFESFYQ